MFIRHLNKSNNGTALYRGGGSIGIIGAARSGLMVAPHPDDETRRVLSRVKGNLSARPADWEYSIKANSDNIPFITWHGVSQYAADRIVSSPQTDDERRSGTDDAVDFLREALADRPRLSKELEVEARPLDITVKMLRDARKKLGIKPYRDGGLGAEGAWWYPRIPKASTLRQ